MPVINDVYHCLDCFAPFASAESWDNVGLLAGAGETELTGILVALDVTRAALDAACNMGANLIVTHHPVIFSPLRSVPGGGILAELIRRDVAVLSAHTNLDLAVGGVNDALCSALGLQSPAPFENPDRIGRIASLPEAMSPSRLAEYLKSRLGGAAVVFSGGNAQIRRVAVVSGAGGEYLPFARAAGADALITGEAKHHEFVEAVNGEFPLFAAGHYATEAVALRPLKERLAGAFPAVPVACFDQFPLFAV